MGTPTMAGASRTPLPQLDREPAVRDRRAATTLDLGPQARQGPAAVVALVLTQDRQGQRRRCGSNPAGATGRLASPERRHAAPGKQAPPLTDCADMHAQGGGDLRRAPAFQREQDRSRMVRLGTVAGACKQAQRGARLSIRHDPRSTSHGPSLPAERQSNARSIARVQQGCLAGRVAAQAKQRPSYRRSSS
jgi:hypothetical protein